jgi:peptide/nickel transport system ATP-binding protein
MSALIEVRNLKKYFPTPKGLLHAVDNVSFDVDERTTLGVVGESGCGKSTLGRTVIGLLPATEGSIRFEGRETTDLNSRERKKLSSDMQIIFQDPFSCLDPRMSVRDLIAEPLEVKHLCASSQEKEQRVRELMETVGLAERFASSYPHELDGGRRQRIGIARALALDPKFIVCDEPVSALDVSIQAQILNLLQDLQASKGLTYMFITHNLSVVKHISDHIMVMYLGCVVEKAPKQELYRNPVHPYTEALLSAIPIPSVTQKRQRIILKGEISSPVDPKPGCRFAPRCLYATEQCFAQTPELHEVSPGHQVACHRVQERSD